MHYSPVRSSGGFGIVFVYALMLAVVLIGGWMWEDMSCSSRWGRSGLDTSYGPIQGCLVQVPDGRWVPSDNVRGVDLGDKP